MVHTNPDDRLALWFQWATQSYDDIRDAGGGYMVLAEFDRELDDEEIQFVAKFWNHDGEGFYIWPDGTAHRGIGRFFATAAQACAAVEKHLLSEIDTDHELKKPTRCSNCGLLLETLEVDPLTPEGWGWLLYQGAEFLEYRNALGYVSHEPKDANQCRWCYGLHNEAPTGEADSFRVAAEALINARR